MFYFRTSTFLSTFYFLPIFWFNESNYFDVEAPCFMFVHRLLMKNVARGENTQERKFTA